MRLDASAYKMCVATFPSPLNRTARSRRAGPRARRLPDQLAWETLSRSAREGGEQLPLERLFGKLGFGIIFPFLGAAGFIFHWAVNPASTAPVIGASGAIATLMGSYLVLFPQARMRTLIFFGIGYKRVNMPAWSFLLYWISLQLMSLAFGSGAADNVAYAVHVGGFIVGVMGAMIWKVSYPFAEERLAHFTATAFRA
jgi:hypothetical protein